MENLFRILINVIKAKILPIWTKIKLWTNINFIRTRMLTQLRKFFTKIFDIRPRNKDDYYTIWGWMVSKRLAFAVTIVIGLLSIYYVFFMNAVTVLKADESGIKTYKYNSIPLRFTEETVRILGKSGYLAFEGEVSKGTANGNGKLYRKDGSLLYEGAFVKNKYEGKGKLYYPSEQLKYSGNFSDNLFTDTGTLYRENGSKEYEGEFLDGKKEGKGVYYDVAGNEVFIGNFSKDALLYTDFLGKATTEVKEIYTGKKTIYMNNNYFVVSMPDIEAIYYGQADGENLDGNVNIEGIYVLKNSFCYSGKEYNNINDMNEIFETEEYEGNSYITMPEAVAIHVLNQSKNAFYGEVSGEWQQTLEDVINVVSYDTEYTLYLYTFIKDGLRYTFFGKDRTGEFAMYLIEQE